MLFQGGQGVWGLICGDGGRHKLVLLALSGRPVRAAPVSDSVLRPIERRYVRRNQAIRHPGQPRQPPMVHLHTVLPVQGHGSRLQWRLPPGRHRQSFLEEGVVAQG